MRIAFIYHFLQEKLGLGDYLQRGFDEICETVHFLPSEETEGFDNYVYIDDGPTYYDKPKFHPATYIAIDFVIPHVWFVNTPEQYINRIKNFDKSIVFSSATQKYCVENGVNAQMMGFACDPEYHRPYDVRDKLDWVAVWHNCGDRVQAIEAAYKRFPNGRVLWCGIGPTWLHERDYAYYISSGRCALNWPRANIVNMRVFEVMAIGVPLVTMRIDDMAHFGFIENEHYLGYSDVGEMLEKISWVLDNPVEAGQISARAKELVLAEHTYYHRARDIIRT